MGAFDKTVTVPGIGVRLSLRGALQMLCQVGDLDAALCRAITQRPEDACKTLFDKYGEAWVKKQLNKAFYVFIGSVLEDIGCPSKSDWKDIVMSAVDVQLSSGGIDFDIDLEGLSKTIVCAVATRAVVQPFGAVVETIVRELRNACSVVSSSSSTSTPVSSSSGSSSSRDAFIADARDYLSKAYYVPRQGAPQASAAKKSYFPLALAVAGTGGLAFFLYKKRR